MLKIKNMSPLGDLDVPLLGRVVKSGEVVEVSPEHAQQLLRQGDLWQATDSDPSQRPPESAKKPVWLEYAKHLEVEGADDMTKPELIEATAPAVVEGDGVVGFGEDGIPILFAAEDGEDNDGVDVASVAPETKGE